MILVYLADRTRSTAIQAGYDIERHIKKQRDFPCPNCGSEDIFISRKSDGATRWMEIEAKCNDCPTQFAVPDNVLRGFWRNSNEVKLQPLKVKDGIEFEDETEFGD